MTRKVYAPRKSHGWVFLSLLVFPFLIIGGFLMHLYLTTGVIFLLIPTGISLGTAILFLIILCGLPSMKYELDYEKITIKCGLLKYIVPFSSIKKITKRDLEISLWSSFRFPGLALFKVLYADVGNVKMCATSASKGIILIETDNGLYGITPANEDKFMADFRSRTGGK